MISLTNKVTLLILFVFDKSIRAEFGNNFMNTQTIEFYMNIKLDIIYFEFWKWTFQILNWNTQQNWNVQ